MEQGRGTSTIHNSLWSVNFIWRAAAAPHHAGEVRTAEARGSATPMRSVNGVQGAGERVFAH